MTNDELADNIEVRVSVFLSAVPPLYFDKAEWQQIIAALRRSERRSRNGFRNPERRDQPSGEMVMVLREINSRFEELFHELPQDSSWWTAGDRRARKTWDKLRALLSAAEAEDLDPGDRREAFRND